MLNSKLQIPNSTPPLVVVVGPTASGKSALSMKLAQKFDSEVICADSRTVYKGLDIGTAKPSKTDQQTVRHHLLDIVEPDEAFTAADFKRLANQAIDDITARGKLPIMVGGSGLYIDAVLFDYQFSPEDAPRDEQNPRHLRSDVPRPHAELRLDTLVIGLEVERTELKRRIVERVKNMVNQGFIEEVEWLLQNYPDSKALSAPGYKAFQRYLKEEIFLEEAADLFVRNDYKLAKRQETWFRSSRYDALSTSNSSSLAAANSGSIDRPKGTSRSPESTSTQRSSNLNKNNDRNEMTRNERIQWVNNQRQAVDLVTTFLYKYQ